MLGNAVKQFEIKLNCQTNFKEKATNELITV